MTKEDFSMLQNYDRQFECPLERSDQGNEFELILTCCRPVALEVDFQRQAELAKKNLDTNKVLELARRHKVASLLYGNLKTHRVGTFDQVLIDELAALYKKNVHKAMKSFQALHQIAKSNADFQIYVMKGLDVAVRAYHDIGVRDVGDIDLLVASEHMSAVYSNLVLQGWHSKVSLVTRFFTSKILRNSHCDLTLFQAAFPRLELHWRPTHNPYEFPMACLSSQLTSGNSSTGLYGFGNEDLLIYLCVHGSKHGWGRLKWLFDLPNVIEKLNIEWDTLWQKADRLGVSLVVQQGLMLASRFCHVELTTEIVAGFKHKISRAQWHSIREFQSGPELWMEYPPAHLLIYVWLNRIGTATTPKIFIWHLLAMFNPSINDFDLLRLPERLEYLYFIFRPFTWSIRRLKIWKARTSAA
ncbi:nucleotidyltransferase family protein [Undibacterium sp. Ji67W]|uniref:nucleotidyltransferase family protein n=1 Tax=Undibacterium sp. Ji67W TaxID=3413042 RepID=UPI003BF3FC7A